MNLNSVDIIFIYANQRSGHHAIINWLCNQIEYNVIHHNDLNFDSLVNGNYVYKGGIKKTKYENSKENKTIQVINFENTEVKNHEKLIKNKFFKDKKTVTLLVLRDFYNNMASVIKSTPKNKLSNKLKTHKIVWKEISSLYLNQKFYTILYNDWILNEKYREEISKNLGLKFTDKGFEKLSPFGGGSSFNDHNNKNRLERYKQFLKNEDFIKVINDDEIKKLNKKIFSIQL